MIHQQNKAYFEYHLFMHLLITRSTRLSQPVYRSLSTDVREDLFISPFNSIISHSEMIELNGSAMGGETW
jgi:hypothetical protein